MYRCPSCNEIIFEGSTICPECGFVIDDKNPFASVDNELERFSQMVFNMENNLGEYVGPETNVDTTLSSSDVKNNSDTGNEEILETSSVDTSTPIVFRASAKGVEKVVETPEVIDSFELLDDSEINENNELDDFSETIEPDEEDVTELVEENTEDSENVGYVDTTDEVLETNEYNSEVNDDSDEDITISVDETIDETTEETLETAIEDDLEVSDENEYIEETLDQESQSDSDLVLDENDDSAQIEQQEEQEVEEKEEETEESEVTESVEETEESEIAELEVEETETEEEVQELEVEEILPDTEFQEFMDKQYDEFIAQQESNDYVDNADTKETSKVVENKEKDNFDIFNLGVLDTDFDSNMGGEVNFDFSYFKNPPDDEVEPIYDVTEASKTYLTLNFVTTDKFATLISNENEQSDESEEVMDTKENRYVDLIDLDAIINSEQLSSEELESTIKAVTLQRDEMKQSLEMADKKLKIDSYKMFRQRLFSGLKSVGVFILIFLCVYLFMYIGERDSMDLKSELYQKANIEEYDKILVNSILKTIDGTLEVDNQLSLYENGKITKSELLNYCNEFKIEISTYKNIYDKPVYDEAESYLFSAKNIYFFCNYYVDNIISYLNTGDEYYITLNKIMSYQVSDMKPQEIRNREDFLTSVGFTDEEIAVLNMKIQETIK